MTLLVQKGLIRLVTGSTYRAHTEPLFYANRILTVFDINVYMSGVFMYKCLKEPTTDIFQCYFQTNRDVHGRNTRNADALNVPFARLDIRKFNMRINGAVLWNALPPFVCNSASLSPWAKTQIFTYRYHLGGQNLVMFFMYTYAQCII